MRVVVYQGKKYSKEREREYHINLSTSMIESIQHVYPSNTNTYV